MRVETLEGHPPVPRASRPAPRASAVRPHRRRSACPLYIETRERCRARSPAHPCGAVTVLRERTWLAGRSLLQLTSMRPPKPSPRAVVDPTAKVSRSSLAPWLARCRAARSRRATARRVAARRGGGTGCGGAGGRRGRRGRHGGEGGRAASARRARVVRPLVGPLAMLDAVCRAARHAAGRRAAARRVHHFVFGSS